MPRESTKLYAHFTCFTVLRNLDLAAAVVSRSVTYHEPFFDERPSREGEGIEVQWRSQRGADGATAPPRDHDNVVSDDRNYF